MIDKNPMFGYLAAAPIAGLFVVLILVVRSRSVDGRTRGQTRHIRRWTIIRWVVLAIAFSVSSFFMVQRDHFAPSWTFTAWITFAAFLAGEAFGRWEVERILDDDQNSAEVRSPRA
jgi:hypothetical protein